MFASSFHYLLEAPRQVQGLDGVAVLFFHAIVRKAGMARRTPRSTSSRYYASEHRQAIIAAVPPYVRWGCAPPAPSPRAFLRLRRPFPRWGCAPPGTQERPSSIFATHRFLVDAPPLNEFLAAPPRSRIGLFLQAATPRESSHVFHRAVGHSPTSHEAA
jgi:hypothetical protein